MEIDPLPEDSMRRMLSMVIATIVLSACGGDKAVSPNVVPPVADSINPARGTVGTVLRVMGTGFSDSARVFFNGFASP